MGTSPAADDETRPVENSTARVRRYRDAARRGILTRGDRRISRCSCHGAWTYDGKCTTVHKYTSEKENPK